MKAIILARVSDKKQDSNEAQVVRVSDYIKRTNLTVWKTYEIEESSTKGDTGCSLIHAYWYTPVSPGANTNTIKKAEQTTCAQTSLTINDFHELLSPEINITASLFKIDDVTGYPPKAFFWLKGYAGARERDKTEFEVQTTISQRN